MNDLLAFALHLADVADPISMRHFRRGPSSRTKDDGTIVTEADEAVERAIRTEIRAAYPAHGIVGEEEGVEAGGDMRWIVDPIDGTQNYAWGIPVWATLIALESSGEIVAGVVSAPALGERYDAGAGLGARRNGETIRVSDVGTLAEVRLGHTDVRSFAKHGRADGFDRLSSSVRACRGVGDFWGHTLVAAGALDVMVEPVVNVWDLAPLLVIVEEAGGRFTDLSGERRIDGGSVLTTNGAVHEEALACFR